MINFKEVGGDLSILGKLAFPAAVYGRDVVEKVGQVLAGAPQEVSFDVAWVAGIVGLAAVGSWVGARLDQMRRS